MQLLWSKPVPLGLIRDLKGECSQLTPFYQVFPRLAQHSVYCISCLRKIQLNALASPIENRLWSWSSNSRILMAKPSLTLFIWDTFLRRYHTNIPTVQYIFRHLTWYFKWENETDFWLILRDQKHAELIRMRGPNAGAVIALQDKR
jgi:hypothetical protein